MAETAIEYLQKIGKETASPSGHIIPGTTIQLKEINNKLMRRDNKLCDWVEVTNG